MSLPVTVSSGRFSATVEVKDRLCLSEVVRDGRQLLAPQGSPLITPWFGRLPDRTYRWGGTSVTVPESDPRAEMDRSGRPLHGLRCAPQQWHVFAQTASSVSLHSDDLSGPSFPFPFCHRVTVSLGEDGVSVATTLVASESAAVPVAFGWHPYLLLSSVRQTLEEPVVSGTLRDRVLLDASLPSGGREKVWGAVLDGLLDDAWECSAGAEVTVVGSAGPVTLSWDAGYGWAVTWGPEDSAFVCVEPLAGPLNPFALDSRALVVPPGGEHTAGFFIS